MILLRNYKEKQNVNEELEANLYQNLGRNEQKLGELQVKQLFFKIIDLDEK